ncbi:putative sterigmatocystin 8-o-methyltransferase protein [Phaeoacremonium minimum UCRPA7]|uniref:Putative sterigmatocystin 8-o-methyltransferase protein n=1 Tax=Phaeoacremonium minimum (strain UCR-PA7) TaxID=1286976 RepID=R8B9A3_PHAM7|nr:putative sterigmatocystin 8-o-methyltransferase protein [Phaeoacremonium minimum UCRPA7]EON95867.1 putative sterigmatocystin 8-o-methyltransferase protein [Phaeoacremonium minimum UCRPA7]
MASADQLLANLRGIEANTFANEAERIRARDGLLETLRKVQSPWDLAWDHNWANGATNAAIKTLIDAGVFKKWAEAGGEPITCSELAHLTGADVLLIKTAADTYARTPWAKALAEDSSFPGMYGGFYHELNNPMFRTLPFFLKETGFKNPTDVNDCNFQFWRGKDANMFQYVGTNPLLTSDFNDAMECHSKYNLTPWPEVYPTDTVVAAAKPERPLVVDVGGGKGHDLKKFLARHPEIPAGSLVLQDLPDILKGVESDQAISVQPYDFFTPQTVVGARVYFMHNVLHDWPNTVATQILKNIAGAMERGYSRLLIHESLVTEEKPLARVTVSDMTMMACLAAAERSVSEWHELVASAGLQIIKIWRPVQSVESIIEAELA